MAVPDYEIKWSQRFVGEHVYEADPDERPKFFVTFPFPYMDGPLHVGHGYTVGRLDALARYKRARGYNVLFPWAWHWTGQPIAGEAKRIAEGDPKAINPLVEIAGVSMDEVKKFTDPVYLAKYFTRKGKETLTKYGVSIDWRREFFTTSYNPGFNAFVTWQYNTLRKLGYVVKGTHPVVWCPRDLSPVGDHDRLQGEGVSPEEMTAVKFELISGKFKGAYLVAVTFRPETLYGVTNVWLSPTIDYAEVEVSGERWIVGKGAVQKLLDQGFSVRVLTTMQGDQLIGESVKVPLTASTVPVLPATFIDPEFGTAVVFSVPAHAPLDYLALKDLGMPRQPISVIKVEGYGDYPAVEECERESIRGQSDPKAEDATKKIYSLELRKGVMVVGDLAGMKVSEARKAVSDRLKNTGLGFAFYELPEKVVCRCGTTCDVKILQDQWFLKYSDPELKARARRAIENMKFYPPAARQAFLDVLDWVGDKPCARRSGLGTPLPWDTDWLVETLSDSTIYMAYYTISKYVNAGLVKPESMTTEFFDYVLLGEGDVSHVSSVTHVPVSLLDQIRHEFDYWYPVDVRASGKDLVSNHLIFFILQHVAIFPESKWPKAIAVNGFASIEGSKMSKSKGLFVTLDKAIERRGSDALRLALINSAEGMDDPDFKWADVDAMGEKVESFLSLVKQITSDHGGKPDDMDLWIEAKFNRTLEQVASAMEEYRTRTALNYALFEFWLDFRWYVRRRTSKGLAPYSEVALEVLKSWTRVLELFMPYASEEAWEMMGEKAYISTQPWPKPFEVSDESTVLGKEEYMQRLFESAKEVMSLWAKRGSKASSLIIHQSESVKPMVDIMAGRLGVDALPREQRSLYKKLVSVASQLGPNEKTAMEKLALQEEVLLNEAAAFLSSELGIPVVVGQRGKFRVGDKEYVPVPLRPLFEVA
ncbi:leucine--tRNA ligase [Tardisphaera miroshnichenkoae]